MKNVFYLIGLGFIALSGGCQKDDNTPTDAPKATSMLDLKAAPEFNWSTSTTIFVELTGLPTVEPVEATLNITDNAGNVYYGGFHAMSENLSLQLVVPKTEKELILTFGAIKQKATITDGKISFSFIPLLTN